jgi:hypothetical protein
MTDTPQDSKREYRPRTKLASKNPDGENESVHIPDGALAVSIDFNESPLGAGHYIIEYLEPVDR